MEKQTRFKPSQIKDLLHKQDFKCFLSGRELTPSNIEAEHIIPLAKGGKHEIDNICLIIDSLRDLKRYYTIEEIRDLCKDVLKVAIK